MPSLRKKSFAAEQLAKRQQKKPTLLILLVIMGLIIIIGGVYVIKTRFLTVETPETEIKSIAVLPLDNMSGDPEQLYFTDGMHEALINNLSKIGALRVISRTSVMQFRETDKTVPEIALELGVDAVIEGSVYRADNQVRITVQLIAAEPEQHLWSNEYTRELRDVMSLQNEVAQAIAGEIKIAVTPEEELRLSSARAVNPEAYEAYLLGRHYLRRLLEPEIKRAIEYFEQALAIDSTYAHAYAGIADAYVVLGDMLLPEDTLPKARAAAEKALAIDEGLAEAHISLALIKIYYDWDWPGAEREFKRALDIYPNSADTRAWYAYFLLCMGRHDDAIAQNNRAWELDSRSMFVNFLKSWILSDVGHYDKAIQAAGNLIDLYPENPWGHWILAYTYADQGLYEEAIIPFRTSMDLLGDDICEEIGILGYLYGRLGRKAEALKQLGQLDELSAKGKYVTPLARSWIYIGLEDMDMAFVWLEKGYEGHAAFMVQLNLNFFYDSIRSDPRFKALLKKMGLPEN